MTDPLKFFQYEPDGIEIAYLSHAGSCLDCSGIFVRIKTRMAG
jgi:hypothetical protein